MNVFARELADQRPADGVAKHWKPRGEGRPRLAERAGNPLCNLLDRQALAAADADDVSIEDVRKMSTGDGVPVCDDDDWDSRV